MTNENYYTVKTRKHCSERLNPGEKITFAAIKSYEGESKY